jgi:predicted DNA-binding transcriptional regulator AlpA
MSVQVLSPDQDTTQYLPARKVLQRLQISDMTLWRYLRDPRVGFPHPVRFGVGKNPRRYFKLSELEAWERAKATEGRAA